MANTYCEYTQVAPTDNNTWTFSCWFKRAAVTTEMSLFSGDIDGSNQTKCRLMGDGTIQFMDYQSSANTGKLTTLRKFRDPTAWYHIVCVWDSDNGTAGDRMKMYINGVEETAFSDDVNPSSGQATVLNANTRVMRVGRDYDGGYWQGCISHVQFVDGLALAPTEFGEFDSTSGIWKLKTGSYATPGNNGFHLKMEDASNLDLDSSSNTKSFTTTGDLTPTKDNPSNNFCTMNPLDNYLQEKTYSCGNNKVVSADSSIVAWNTATLPLIAPFTGKWYWECLIDGAATSNYNFIGWVSKYVTAASGTTAHLNDGFSGVGGQRILYDGSDGNIRHVTGGSYGDAFTTGDYIGVYTDFDNNKIYFSKNGVIQASGTGWTIVPTDAHSDFWSPSLGFGTGSGLDVSYNFGNGVFGSTVLTGTTFSDNDSIGTFKYSPNASGASSFDSSAKNFMALCTTNISTYG